MRQAFWGGSFNPPHAGHQLACLVLLEMEGYDRVWLVPCRRHAFGKQLVPFEHRLQMCRLVAEPFGDRVVVSDVEGGLEPGRPNRTIETLELLERRGESGFELVIGSDLVGELDQWHRSEELLSRYTVLVLPRAGHHARDARFRYGRLELPSVSSSQVREALAAGKSVRGLVPASVADYIERHSLYR
ncbi:MAG: nicotinate (nicotinamide) nucleotide adenylyltransferase [Deltaproteobacteria bacterium]|nr:MAG: nicotinate (nicotinamide) nucleotide adenylyltransferase [Deltaproteobacteria bacterium]